MEQVYWEYIDQVAGLVRRGFRLKDDLRVPGVKPELLEDLVQEIFAKAFNERARLSFDGLREYRPFLFTIARNVVIDFARHAAREISLDDWPDDLAAAVPSSDEDAPWADPITAALVQDYVRELPAALAAVHRERYVLGHPQRVAAAALGISRQQLRTREQRLRQGLDSALRGASRGAETIINPNAAPERTK